MSAPEELADVAARVMRHIEAHRKPFDPAFSTRVDTRDYIERKNDAEYASLLEEQCLGKVPVIRIVTEEVQAPSYQAQTQRRRT